MKPYQPSAFTLAELLIALAILGVIATFTIPKILDSGTGTKNNSVVMETTSVISGALKQLQLNSGLSQSTTFGDLTPYINYTRLVTTTHLFDWNNTTGSGDCGLGHCLMMHNSSLIYYQTWPFGSTDTTAAFYVTIDPDSVYGGSTTGPSKGTTMFFYYNGRVRSQGTVEPNTYFSGNPYGPLPARDPEYLSWGN